NQTLRRLTLPVARITHFDELPTPFRAVATDLETGEPVVMGAGDLTSAMRASVSAPGIFAPVEREGRVLVDGGIADNVPVDIARAMGVDVVIVVDVGFPLVPRRQLNSVAAISNQMLAILIRRNAEQQLASLTPRDILIEPALGATSSFDFGGVARIIGLGEAAARAAAPQLSRLEVSDEDMQRYVQRRDSLRRPPPRIDFVTVDTGSDAYSRSLDTLFKDLTGKPLDPDKLAQRVTALYGAGGLDTLDYHVVGDESRYGLALDARPSSMGPNYLRFGLSLQDECQGNSTYNAAVRFVMSGITRSAGEWVNDLQVGKTEQIATELFLPLAQFSGWFIDPHAAAGSHDVDVLQGQSLLAEYRAHTFDYGSDFGYQFGNWGEIRVGALREEGHFRLKIGDPRDPNLPVQPYQPFTTRQY
ncbi:MAG: patatin-like phospholipase family protein, partial [Streptosporangiaceae bacterium]